MDVKLVEFFYGLGMTKGYQLNYSHSLSLRLFKSVFDNVLLKYDGQLHTATVHLNLVG